MKIYTERTYYLLIMLSQVATHKIKFLNRLKTCVESKTLKKQCFVQYKWAKDKKKIQKICLTSLVTEKMQIK